MFKSVLSTSVSITAQLFVQWFYAMYYIRHIQNSDIISTLLFQVYAGIFNHIEHYYSIFTHSETLFRFIQAYSTPCVTLAYWQPCHILSLGIFRIGSLFQTLWNVDQAYSEHCHRTLFSHIQTYSEPCATLAYAETWPNRNPGKFRTLS